jgi:hypothetical protein
MGRCRKRICKSGSHDSCAVKGKKLLGGRGIERGKITKSLESNRSETGQR